MPGSGIWEEIEKFIFCTVFVQKGDGNMAAAKKTVTSVTAKVEAPEAEAKKAAPTTPVKTENVTAVKEAEKTPVAKAEEKAPVKAEMKKPTARKQTARKETAKKETAKKETAKKETTRKESAKKETIKKPGAGKAELKSEISVQFGGKSYSQEDLTKIAKDVWKYDLKQNAADLISMELYVKPEENMVYYVMNKEVTGSFYI